MNVLEAQVLAAFEYYPFGMAMQSINLGSYRYGFNGTERDNELSESIYNAPFWEYDTRLGRRWNIDPLGKPFESPYVCFTNNPIYFSDPSGLTGEGPEKHTIKAGDTYWDLSKNSKGKFSVEDLKRWNPGVNPNTLKIGSQINISDPTKKADLKLPNYEEMFKKKPQILLMMQGISTTANRLYGEPLHPEVLLNLSEEQKEKDFKTSADKTTAILLMEFFTGTGPERRSFDESHSITQEVKWSYSSNRAAWAFSDAYKSGKIKEGEEFKFYAAFSPDKTNWFKSLRYHANAYYTARSVFYRGGMMYYMKLTGTTLQVKVVDSYNIASGVTRDGNTNIKRIPGQVTPLGNTYVEFHFEYTNVDPNK